MLAPPCLAASRGMTTVRSGAALRVTVTSTVFSVTPGVPGSSLSATVYAALPKLTVTDGTSSVDR